MVGGRPKKTAEELDAEMADYFNRSAEEQKANGVAEGVNGGANTAPAVTADAVNLPPDEDIDMIE